MTYDPKFDLEKIIVDWSGDEERRKRIVVEAQRFLDSHVERRWAQPENDVFLVEAGGTLSSGYDPSVETIRPYAARAAWNILSNLKEVFGIVKGNLIPVTIFSKDSRDIENGDLELLLGVIDRIDSKRILVTCGTWMMPRISELLMRTERRPGQSIALTGSMLPHGFSMSDAALNVVSALTILNERKARGADGVCVVFHGEVFDTLNSVRGLNLHVKEPFIGYPQTSVPTIS